jgi:uncharacterized SAM-binding protein YcdF (DUF218 family)
VELGYLKPLLTTLALPPAGLIALALAGVVLARRWRWAAWVSGLALVLLWTLSTHGIALWLARHLLPLPAVVTAQDLRQAQVQAVVVLGGGVLPEAPEYGQAQPNASTWARLRFGVRLAREQGLPLGFAGGVGWGGRGTATEAEAVVDAAWRDLGVRLRWVDDRSKDTADNAREMATRLQADGVRRIALVSDAWHLPRAAAHFRAAGLQVLPAPTRVPLPRQNPLLEWLPSTHGLDISYWVLREWIALRLTTPPA